MVSRPATLALVRSAGCVDVVIPTFDARDLVSACVDRLSDAAIASITVVDDASGDGTADALADRPAVRVVRLERHRGLAYALNRGAREGSGRAILFLNNDIFAPPGAVDRLLAALDANPDAASAAGRLIDPKTRRTQSSYQPRSIPGPAAVIARLTGLERWWPRNPLTGQHLRAPLPEDRPSVTLRQPAGACLLVRRADHEAIGGWDEHFSFWYEDVDYARRLARRGPTVYEPAAAFAHVGRASSARWSKPDQHRRLYHGTLVYSSLHFGRAGRIVVGSTAAIVASARVGPFTARGDRRAAATYREIARQGFGVALSRVPPFPEIR
jgi:GT2 family glycosyltransferase